MSLAKLEDQAEEYWHSEEGAPVVVLEFGGEDSGDDPGRLAYLTGADAERYLDDFTVPVDLPHPHDWCESRVTHSRAEWAELVAGEG
jgi:hypothetical protein